MVIGRLRSFGSDTSVRDGIAAGRAPLFNRAQKQGLPRRKFVAKDAIVSKELAEKFKTEKDTPYLRFVRGDGLDIISAQYVPNLCTVDLKPWPRRGDGAKGVFINHEASRTSNDCYVCEIAPGKKLEPRHHLFEEMIMVLSGRGSTTVWNNSGARVTFEWKAGSIFAIPLNCWYQHFNGSGQEVVRLVAVTNFPSVMNLYEDVDFVFNFDLRLQEPLLRRAGLLRRPRASRTASCCGPISSPTPSTCR